MGFSVRLDTYSTDVSLNTDEMGKERALAKWIESSLENPTVVYYIAAWLVRNESTRQDDAVTMFESLTFGRGDPAPPLASPGQDEDPPRSPQAEAVAPPGLNVAAELDEEGLLRPNTPEANQDPDHSPHSSRCWATERWYYVASQVQRCFNSDMEGDEQLYELLKELLSTAGAFSRWARNYKGSHIDASNAAAQASEDLQVIAGKVVRHVRLLAESHVAREDGGSPMNTVDKDVIAVRGVGHAAVKRCLGYNDLDLASQTNSPIACDYTPGNLIDHAIRKRSYSFFTSAAVQDFISLEFKPVIVGYEYGSWIMRPFKFLFIELFWLALAVLHMCLAGGIVVGPNWHLFKETWWSPERKDRAWNTLYAVFLCFLPFVVAPNVMDRTVSHVDIVVGLWLTSLAWFKLKQLFWSVKWSEKIEERTVSPDDLKDPSFWSKWGAGVAVFFDDPWNIFDSITFVVTLIAFSLRVAVWRRLSHDAQLVSIEDDSALMVSAVLFHTAAIILLILRVLQVLGRSKKIGPLLLIIADMLRDILRFLAIFLPFVVAFAAGLSVVMQKRAVEAYEATEGEDVPEMFTGFWMSLRSMTWTGTFGEFMDDALEEVSGGNTPYDVAGQVLMMLYLFLALVMLLNMLIAVSPPLPLC